MPNDAMTYRQLDDLLLHLGFSRLSVRTKWLRYEHPASGSVIVVVAKQPHERVRITDAVSARQHLVEKGIIGEAELDKFLTREAMAQAPVRKP